MYSRFFNMSNRVFNSTRENMRDVRFTLSAFLCNGNSRISRFLVQRIQEKGKTPRLISGYDEVAELYKQVGFETCGRWGELYL